MQDHRLFRIGYQIHQYRLLNGFTERELAEGICSVSTLHDIENGRTFATLDVLKKFADRLQVPLQNILVEPPKETFSPETPLHTDQDYRVTQTYRKILDMIEQIEEMERQEEHPLVDWHELMLNKADALINTHQADKAMEMLHDLLARAEADPDSDKMLLATLHHKLGNAYFALSNPLEAYTHYMHAYLISAHVSEFNPLTTKITFDLAKVAEQLGGTKQLADQLFELGVQERNENNLSKAYTYLEQANALYKSQNIIQMGQEMRAAYQTLLRTKERPELAIQELMFSAKRFEKAGDTNQLANTYARMADLHLNLNQTTEAGHYIGLALGLFTEEMAQEDPRLIIAYHVQARYCLRVGDQEQSIVMALKASELAEKIHFRQQAADSLHLAATAYREQGQPEKAREMEERAQSLQMTPL